MQIIRKNFGLKLLSFVLAMVGWAYFRFATNPIVAAAHFSQQLSLPITTMNLGPGLIVHDTDTTAVVTVDRKPGAPAIRPDEIRAVLDLSNKGPGVYNVPIALVAPDVAVQSLSPASVTLTIERNEQRAFTIVVHYVGAQPGVVVADQKVLPNAVTVQGPSSVVSQVTAVRVDLVLPNAPLNADESLRPQPVNAMGAEVSGLQVAPDLVRVETKFAAAHGAGAAR